MITEKQRGSIVLILSKMLRAIDKFRDQIEVASVKLV